MEDSTFAEGLIVIGDVHGHLDKLLLCWSRIEEALGGPNFPHDVVFLGDYCDRGHA